MSTGGGSEPWEEASESRGRVRVMTSKKLDVSHVILRMTSITGSSLVLVPKALAQTRA